MKPRYFPHTFLPPAVVSALGEVFAATVVYQPSSLENPSSLEAPGIEVRVPVDDDRGRLAAILDEYRRWGDLHQGGGLEFFKSQAGRVPFYGESSVQQIRTDIRRGPAPRGGTGLTAADRLFGARVFLQLAQAFDRQTWELDHRLQAHAGAAKALMRTLRGEEGGTPADTPDVRWETWDAVSLDYLSDERLAAWSRLRQQDPETAGIFISASRPAVEALLERRAAAAQIAHWRLSADAPAEARRAWRAALLPALERLVREGGAPAAGALPAPPAGDGRVALTLYRLPDTAAAALFAIPGVGARGVSTAPDGRQTILGLLSAD